MRHGTRSAYNRGCRCDECRGASRDHQRLRRLAAGRKPQRPGSSFGDDFPERFWARVTTGPGCWLWSGATKNGRYGYVQFRGRIWAAHRVAWHLTHGEIPPGLVICHKCDVEQCCRPDHLFVGTQADNMRDMREKGRARNGTGRAGRETHCLHGHSMADPYVNPRGIRICRTCRADGRKRYLEKRAATLDESVTAQSQQVNQ